jgi:hypothetical protein
MSVTTTQLLSSGEFCKLRYDTIRVKSASANVSLYTNNSKMPNFELWHSCRKWAILCTKMQSKLLVTVFSNLTVDIVNASRLIVFSDTLLYRKCWLVCQYQKQIFIDCALELVGNFVYHLHNCWRHCSRHSSWTAWSLKMGSIGCPETSVRN